MTPLAENAGTLENRAGNRLAQLLAKRRNKSPNQSWLIVYLDIITLLLAMFILLVNDPGETLDSQTNAPLDQPAPVTIVEEETPIEEPQPIAPEPIEEVITEAPAITEQTESTEPGIAKPEAPVLAEVTDPGESPTELTPEADKTDEPTKTDEMLLEQPVPSMSDADRILQQLETIDGEQMVINIKEGEINLQLPESILFATGQAELLPQAVDLLKKIAPILVDNSYPISIEGHSDNVPIQTQQFPSNWELSAARATVVLRKLAELGVDYRRMKAIGYADTNPVSDNDSEQGRGKNRRVNILIHASEP